LTWCSTGLEGGRARVSLIVPEVTRGHTHRTTCHHRHPPLPGTLLGVASMILDPALIGLALATPHEPWRDTVPDYDIGNSEHDLLMLSFNLAAAAFPFLAGSRGVRVR
jgi:hypothetical protein